MPAFTQSLEEIKAALNSAVFLPAQINHTFKTTAGYSPLITPQAETKESGKTSSITIELDKKERAFTSSGPVYIRKIVFKGKNTKNIELEVSNFDGSRKIHAVTDDASGGSSIICDFSERFTVRSKSSFGRPHITSITVYGYIYGHFSKLKTSLNDFASACYRLEGTLAKASSDVSQADSKITQLNENIQIAQTTIDEQSTTISAQTEKIQEQDDLLSEIKNNLTAYQSTLDRLTRDETIKQNNISQLEKQSKDLNSLISEQAQDLSKLVNEKSLISDEFHDYIKEGKGQSKIYTALMTAPFLVILICVGLLYDGASDLLFDRYEDKQEIIAALLLRIPFATVLGIAIYYSWTIANMFLSKIFQVQEERLALAKLLVIAKDTVYSTAEELDISQSEKFEMRTRLKIEMLKAHLAHNLGANFDPIPTRQANNAEDTEEN